MGRINLSARFTQEEIQMISDTCKIMCCSPKDLVRLAVLRFTMDAARVIHDDVLKLKDKEDIGENKLDRDDG